jgi:hypothetical protein
MNAMNRWMCASISCVSIYVNRQKKFKIQQYYVEVLLNLLEFYVQITLHVRILFWSIAKHVRILF